MVTSEQWTCKECDEYKQQARNCDGAYGGFRMPVGEVIIDQCPLSLVSENALYVIDVIEWSDESGIPWEGTCLADQTEKYRLFRQVIKSEQGKVREEVRRRKKSLKKKK